MDRAVHVAESPRGRVAHLPVDRKVPLSPAMREREVLESHKHTARAAARVVHSPLVWLDHLGEQAHDGLRRPIVWHQPLRRPRPYDSLWPVEPLPQAALLLLRVLLHLIQLGHHERRLLIVPVARIRSPASIHTAMIAPRYVHMHNRHGNGQAGASESCPGVDGFAATGRLWSRVVGRCFRSPRRSRAAIRRMRQASR